MEASARDVEAKLAAREQDGAKSSTTGRDVHGLRGTIAPRAIIIGMGFGGLSAARKLAGTNVNVLALDRNNYHGFWPLLYQVATAGLEAESIGYPVRAIFRKRKNISFKMAQVTGVDLDKRVVYLEDGQALTYDYLVLAAGSTNNYFGHSRFERETLGLKDIDEAERLRNRVLLSFEEASGEPDPQRKQALMTLAIVGGGPTGVELSGAFAELIAHVLRKDYPALNISQAGVVLIEAGNQLLATFPRSLQERAREKLESMGVQVLLNNAVSSVEDGVVKLKDGQQLKANTIVWAAGVKAATLADTLATEHGKGGRVKVEPTLNIPGHPEAFVIGDMAYLEGYKEGQPYPMVAQVAIQQGKTAARNILAAIHGRPMRPFRYFDEGQMATIGRNSAVLESFGIKLSGLPAWLGWLFIHIVYLIGFRNRLVVLMNWAVNYFTYDRAIRIITGRNWTS